MAITTTPPSFGVRTSSSLFGVPVYNDLVNLDSKLTVDTWHALTFQNSWTNQVGIGTTGQYRLLSPASAANLVQVVGTFTPGTKTDNTVVATLPVGYRPAHDILSPIFVGALAAVSPAFMLDTGGNLRCFGCASTTNVWVNAIYPLTA